MTKPHDDGGSHHGGTHGRTLILRAEGSVFTRPRSWLRTTRIWPKRLADNVVFLQDGHAQVFGSWAEFENSTDPFLRDFLLQDELIPALDVTL